MNKLMWEIAEKAKDQGPNFHYYDPVFLIEYTRLIVEECATLAYDGPNGILEHFGVEE